MASVAVAQIYTRRRRFGPVRAVHRDRGAVRAVHRGPVVPEVPYAPYTAGPVVHEVPYAAYTEKPYAPYTAGPVVRECRMRPTPCDEPYAPSAAR